MYDDSSDKLDRLLGLCRSDPIVVLFDAAIISADVVTPFDDGVGGGREKGVMNAGATMGIEREGGVTSASSDSPGDLVSAKSHPSPVSSLHCTPFLFLGELLAADPPTPREGMLTPFFGDRRANFDVEERV